MAAGIAAAGAVGASIVGLVVSRDFQCGCQYGNCGCRPIGTPVITPQQSTPAFPTFLPYASPTIPFLDFPNPQTPTLPPFLTFVPTIQSTLPIQPTWTPYFTATPIPLETLDPSPTSIISTPPSSVTPGPSPTPSPTLTPSSTPTPTPTLSPTPTQTPFPTATPVACGFLTIDRSFPPTIVVRYTVSPALSNPSLSLLPATFSAAYQGYFFGAHEWVLYAPYGYVGPLRLRVLEDGALVFQCDIVWAG